MSTPPKLNAVGADFTLSLLRAAGVPTERVRSVSYEHLAGSYPRLTVTYLADGGDGTLLTETLNFVPEVSE
jgi:hypothetical protein